MASNVRKSTEHVRPDEGAGVDPQQLKVDRERRWLAEHANAIRAENDYIEKHGLPLAQYRLF